MGEQIRFTIGERRELFDNDVVEFHGECGGADIRFWITREALDHLAGTSGQSQTLIESFDEWATRIWEVARAKHTALGGRHDGAVVITEHDAMLFWKEVSG